MDEAELLEATQAFYEAYWLGKGGRREGSLLKAWPDLTQDEIDDLIAGVEAVEAYIAALP